MFVDCGFLSVSQIVKKMIKCCNSLQCHTQVAVLCQCLEEIDYSTAFKALQVNIFAVVLHF